MALSNNETGNCVRLDRYFYNYWYITPCIMRQFFFIMRYEKAVSVKQEYIVQSKITFGQISAFVFFFKLSSEIVINL